MVIRKIFKIFLLIVINEGLGSANSDEFGERHVDVGENITLPCDGRPGDSGSFNGGSVMWVYKGREERQISRLKILSNGSLSLEKVNKEDTGEYSCRLEDQGSLQSDAILGREFVDSDLIRSKYKLFVRTPPPALINVTVQPSTVLALLLWEVDDTGGYDISHFSARYRLKYSDPEDDWHDVIPKRISPTARQIDVYHLSPNSTYTFQIWAANHLGDGEVTEIDGTTDHALEEIELARHLLEGAENFDTRVWVVAVAVVMGTLFMLSAGTCYLLCKEYNFSPLSGDDQEVIELVPNIILNPGFYDADIRSERLYELDENCSDQTPMKVNNNSVIQPIRL
ncbi:UNVERIFIED_CONTAM: hypothetical protein PYX00_005271 [Menopon gallinae]|uniref:Uncharacterized protein n=1 Tax=Menopon gallinae TaxID=328185 RepID=A0AAW2HQM9_9NEOP